MTVQGVPKKMYLQNRLAPKLQGLHHQWLAPLGPGKCFFCRFLLRLSRIKPPQVMSMAKFGPTALHFGYDFVLLMHFLGHPVQPQNYLHPPIWLRFRYYPSKTDLELKTGHPPPNISVYIVSKRKTASHFGIEQRNRQESCNISLTQATPLNFTQPSSSISINFKYLYQPE